MSSSFEKINYILRPNKCVERKMMCEALGRLSFIEHLDKYRYIGFGSPYFADFILFHKNLGITDLISIEKEEAKHKRFKFNIPYSGIKMRYGYSTTILPNLELDTRKNILWLDYDVRITDFMFSDINTFFLNTMPGSFFILSVSVKEDSRPSESANAKNPISERNYRSVKLIERCGNSRIPSEFRGLNMNTKNLTSVTYEMIDMQIKRTLINRNGMSNDEIEYKQIFNFVYNDSTTMLTIGGIIFDKSQKSKVAKMSFDNMSFMQEGSESFKIQCPNLTIREMKELDKALPDSVEYKDSEFTNKKLQDMPLIPTDIINYAKIYRYYPNFAEANI